VPVYRSLFHLTVIKENRFFQVISWKFPDFMESARPDFPALLQIQQQVA
jgi:hypothetical protein